MAKYTYLQREEVLKYIDTLHFRTQYIKIIVLDNTDCPLRAIEGRATGGSINVNGSSAVRRTGSLTLVTELNDQTEDPLDIMNKVTDMETLISMNKRIEIEIGIENSGKLYQEEKIFWIPLGRFIIQNASVTYNNQGIQISLKLTDKMALLNGELGGTITQNLILSPNGVFTNETMTTFDIETNGVKIYDLVESLIRDYGGLQEYEYSIEVPLTVKNIIRWVNSKNDLGINTRGEGSLVLVSDAIHEDVYNQRYTFNEPIGYTETDFVYPLDKDLEVKAGETITQILDKIKNVLGNYEYFFDIDGIFKFREIQSFLNEGSQIDDLTQAIGDKYFLNTDDSKSVYSFKDAALVSSYSNNPQYNQIKNEYVVWGKQKVGELETDIQYHLLLQQAPEDYEDQFWKITTDLYDGEKIDEVKKVSEEEVIIGEFIDKESSFGKSYYKINFSAADRPQGHNRDDDWRLKMYLTALSKEEKKKTILDKEIIEWIPKLYNLNFNDINNFFTPLYNKNSSDFTYWLDIINTKDLSMQKTNVSQFGIENIGRKTKVLNDDKINCLFAVTPPNVNFEKSDAIEGNDISSLNNGTVWIVKKDAYLIDGEGQPFNFWKECVAIGTVQNPAYDLLRSSIHEHLSYNNNINISTMPVYHLDVNQRITVSNKESDIYGDYMINSLTIPLTLNGMMTINARKAIERI